LDKQHAIERDIHDAKFEVYIEEQDIYIPNCIPIEEIKVEPETNYCFKYVPIEFETLKKNGSNVKIINNNQGQYKCSMYEPWIQQENQFVRFTLSNEILCKWENSKFSLKSNNSLSSSELNQCKHK